ncbi:BRO-N domain-containing protein [Clostridium saccharobutylicum]|uniref:Bro-N domain-containing protein n=1 Tax=Clostridium saccharobutylicum DSM 13864 TaxID=1345695 RepID=U5MTU2_CLOSA|nr:BRO family protein [Clostridium saccharobutylicum]AGX43928.1 hypothetical protein CLSA_c29610 [Clostridium saccharobutylicum DSM 13864]AQR91225.1 hypothetical protein CLOSC_29490 [Clostridium saccharobutylicum]AQS01129.1 hypothetical protein CSACC_29560 [Clostridium saccharobutylicum]AQS15112.1 hypothetical protein CLOSACC_29560 [Clostridium saccharobutylicum]MBA2905238.1 prophage antirepressor-like protein [Clostridium saccharobutylicum]
MENKIEIFKNEELGEVRSLTINGEPWFVGKDVAIALGYKDTSDALKVHVDEEDKGVGEMPTPGGKQNMITINESGLYSLIFNSKLPSAKKFKSWVTKEILPSIRKHGMYITDELLKDNDRLQHEIKYLQDKANLSEKLLYAHNFINTQKNVNSYMPSIIINVLNACRKAIIRQDDTAYYFNAEDVKKEFNKYEIKPRRFKEILDCMGGYKDSIFLTGRNDRKYRYECYIAPKYLIDCKL